MVSPSEAHPTSRGVDGRVRIAAEVIVDRLGVGADDGFLVVYNPDLAFLADTLVKAAATRTSDVRRQEFAPLSRDGEEPPPSVAAAMREAQAIALLTRFSLSHTHARLEATRQGARVASLPAITPELFARTIPVDYARLTGTTDALVAALTAAEHCRVRAPGGTDLELSLRGRTALCDDGALRAPGAFGNLPAGEAYMAPVEDSGEGTIVFDGSLGTWGLLEEPLTIEIAEGRAVAASGGGAAEWLLATLDAGGANGRTIAELGIGTNPCATISGRILEDEKAQGTVHVAFGTNTSMGGINQAAVHIDGLVRAAAVELDGRLVLCDGQLHVAS